MNREYIYQALFDLIRKSADFETVSRRLQHWSDVAANKQPAMFLTQKQQTAVTTTGLPTKWTLLADIYIYVHSGEVPSKVLNPLVDSVCNLFIGSGIEGKQTLGGLVHYVRISGSIETDEGVLGDQAVAIIPVEILTAA